MVPKMNGLDLCSWIRSRSDIPVILLTARGEESDRITGLELGADDYVVEAVLTTRTRHQDQGDPAPDGSQGSDDAPRSWKSAG